ncbi:MAG TPA: glycosyltransferase [bacterium]|nr:glycosyltransferase [bacterium]
MSHSNPASPWISLADFAPRCLDLNLEWLRVTEPEFVRDIPRLKNRRDILLQPTGDYFRCKTVTGAERWIFGQSGVDAEIKRYEQALPRILPECRNLFLMGAALGYPLVWIRRYFLDHPGVRVILCEPDPSLLLAAFCVVDLRPYLSSPRFFSYLGPWTNRDLERFLSRAGLAEPERTRVLVCSGDTPDSNNISTVEKIPVLIHSVAQKNTERWDQVARQCGVSQGRSIRRVLFLNAWSALPSGIHIRAIREACARIGLEVSQFDTTRLLMEREPEAYRSRIAADLLDRMESFQPDALVSLGYNQLSFFQPEICERLEIPLFQYVTTIIYRRRDFLETDRVIVAERNLIERLQRLGASKPIFRSMAADDLEPPQGLAETGKVIFVGNSLAPDPNKRRRLEEKWRSRPGFLDSLNEMAEEISHPESEHDLYEMMTNRFQGIDEDEEYDIFDYLLCESSARRRIRILERLIPLGLEIYGGDWDYTLPPDHPLRACLRGVLPPDQVPAMHCAASVVVNIHSVGHLTGPNMRFFNIPGVGGVQVSDAGQEFERYMTDGMETLFFRSEEECVEKVRWLLNHDAVRRQMRHAGRNRVLRDHTYDRWITDVFSAFGYRLPD